MGETLERAARRGRGLRPDGAARRIGVEYDGGLTIRADPAMLDRALGNLVDNAVRHGAGTITLTAERIGREGCRYTVHDEGTHLTADFLPHATERFRRAEAARSSEGSGLSLSLIDAIVTAHRGQMRICANGVHHAQPSAASALDALPYAHPAHGTTVSVLLA